MKISGLSRVPLNSRLLDLFPWLLSLTWVPSPSVDPSSWVVDPVPRSACLAKCQDSAKE